MALEAAALIEDYYFVNPSVVGFGASADERELVDTFCVAEDGYLIIKLNINYSSTSTSMITPDVRTRIYVNGSEVA